MAKVLVSIPDELLKRVDARVDALRQTRSGYLRQLAEADLEDQSRRRAEVKRLMDLIRAGFSEEELSGDGPHVDAAQLIREDRESH